MPAELPDRGDEPGQLPAVSDILSQEERPSGDSLADRLRTKRKQAIEDTHADLPIPGYDRELWVRYRVLDSNEMARIGKNVKRQAKKEEDRLLLSAVDTLITACEGFFQSMDRTAESLEPIVHNEHQLKYDEDLADFLGFTAGSARQVVMGVFAENDPQVIQHSVIVQRWMANTDYDVLSDILGE